MMNVINSHVADTPLELLESVGCQTATDILI
jgi:hypothetical protein